MNDESQSRYHSELFGALAQWDRTWGILTDFAGDDALAQRLGLDQLGHLGPHACDLVADEIINRGAPHQRILELGSGFGGSLRHIVGRLRKQADTPKVTVGVDIVTGHCHTATQIDRTMGVVNEYLTADVSCLPFATGSFDVVICVGSFSHFEDVKGALAEVHRVLIPGGLWLATEEVSLVAGPLDAEFFELHPPGVFYQSSVQERRRQIAAQSLVELERRDLTDWAVRLLRDRVRAMRLFQGTGARVFGAEPIDRLLRTLTSAWNAYRDGRLQPTLWVAAKPDSPRA